jgi:hypothetical protein
MVPQLIPAGSLVTHPVPSPVMDTVSVACATPELAKFCVFDRLVAVPAAADVAAKTRDAQSATKKVLIAFLSSTTRTPSRALLTDS